MAYDPTNPTDARRLLERAVEWTVAPELTSTEVDDLFALAETDGAYPAVALNGAAATGWQWKAQKVAPNFSLSLEDGVKFDRAKVFEHCMAMRTAYLSGQASVVGTPRLRGGIVSIPLVSEIGEVVT